MLKRTLIIIAIITIALALTSNVFGQNSKGKITKNARITKRPSQATGGTIPVYKTGSTTKRKRTPVKNSFESQTQPFADGRVKGKTKSSSKLPIKQVQNFEQTNGGMDTADEKPDLNQRNAKPKDLVNKNPEAKPALLEFQIPEKVVSDNKHPEGQYSRKEADSRKSNPQPKRTGVNKPKGVIILDQDTQTVIGKRKRKNH